jgi:hypothetical protein
MKSLKGLLIVSITIAGLLVSGTAARANTLTITLSSPFQSAVGGDVLVLAFDATVTNNTGATVYLNGDTPTVDSPLTLDDSPYNDNSNWFVLGPGGSYSGLLFNVDIPLGTVDGLYAGNFEIVGGLDNNAVNDIGDATFDVQVTPEPSNFLLLGTALLALGALAGRKLLAG